MTVLSQRGRFAGIIGNVLGHYDTALYGLLAPFIAPLFFNHSNPLTALILAYAIMPLGIITKPLGSLFFGWIGDCLGRKQALFYSLLGMAFVTALMGCLPTYSQIGIWAPCLLAIGRMLQSFCSAGESTGASIFVLENTAPTQRSFMSSLYDISSMSGIVIASGIVALFCRQEWIHQWWRLLFWMGSITAFFGLFLRLKAAEGEEFQKRGQKSTLIQALGKHKRAFVSIILASGFSYTTYAMAFTLMNGYVPLITSLRAADVMTLNTALLVIDMLLLPCFGFLAHRFGKEKVMLSGALCSAIGSIPLFYFLDGANLAAVAVIRFFIVLFGVAFAAPYHAWKLERIPPEHRYTLLSLGCTLGSQLIGAPTSSICLWLYQQSGQAWTPGLYLMAIGTLAAIALYREAREDQLGSARAENR